MTLTPTAPALTRKRLAVTLLIGAVAGGTSVFAMQSIGSAFAQKDEVAPADVQQLLTTKAPAALEVSLPPPSADTSSELSLSARERDVLKRLANLPDLPVVQVPAFDIKVQSAPAAASKVAKSPDLSGAPAAAAPAQPVGESVIARIQVLSVEKGRVFYRSVDENIHTAREGERLLGVNGRVIKVDEHGAELQIDGHRMRVAANNM